MNKVRVQRVIDALKNEEMAFYMGAFGVSITDIHQGRTTEDLMNCGSPGCIAGTAIALYADYARKNLNDPQKVGYNSVYDLAKTLLGLSDDEADQLFYASDCKIYLSNIKRVHAIDTLTRALKTGVIDWDVNLETYNYGADDYTDADDYTEVSGAEGT